MAEVKDNIIQLEKVIQQLNKALDENIKRLNIGAVSLANFSNSFTNIPSQYLRLLSDLADKNKALQATQARLLQVENELAQLRQRLTNSTRERNARTAEEIVNQRTLAQNADRQVRATSALVGAYGNLNARHQEASRRLQDLIVRGRTAEQTQRQYNQELRNAQREFQSLDARIRHADQAVGRFNRNVGNYPRQAVAGIRNLIGAFGVAGGVSLFASIATDIYKTTKELQSLDMALKQVSGTNEQFTRSQAFLSEIAQAYGLEIKSLTTQFTQFYVSAKDKLSATQIEGIFKSISKAGAVMGLSVENQKRAFLALNQMMSKGTVQAEELRGQLGEALPGAFGIMAKAMGTTEQGLAKLMKDGKVLADEVLPKFAKELEKVYGIETIENVKTLSAAQNRLSNTWTDLVRNLNNSDSGGISYFFRGIIEYANALLILVKELNNSKNWDWLKSKETITKRTNNEDALRNYEEELTFLREAKESYKGNQKAYDEYRNSRKLAFEEDLKMFRESANVNKNKIDISKSNIAQSRSSKIIKENKLILELAQKEYDSDIRMIKITKTRLKAYEDVSKTVNKNTKEKDKNTKASEKNNKEKLKEIKAIQDIVKFKEEEQKAQIGSKKWLTDNISSQEKQMDLLAKGSEQYERASASLEYYKYWLELVYGAEEKNTKSLEEKKEKLKELFNSEQFFGGFVNSFTSNSGFSEIFNVIDLLDQKFEDSKEKNLAVALAISEAFQQAFNTISEASQNNFNAEYERLETQKDFAIEMAGGSATAREEIERQYEERKKQIQSREAESKKRLAIFNIAVDTAQAIVASFKTDSSGITAIAIGIIGAVQGGFVASKQIPQFWKGTENAPEGLAWTQEKGAEVITDRNGKLKTLGSSKGAQLTYLSKGDKVYKSHEDYINKVLSKNGIDNLGSYMNFAPQTEIVNSFDMNEMRNEFSKLANVIKNKDGVSISIDEQGFRKRQGNTEFINSRLNLKSRLV